MAYRIPPYDLRVQEELAIDAANLQAIINQQPIEYLTEGTVTKGTSEWRASGADLTLDSGLQFYAKGSKDFVLNGTLYFWFSGLTTGSSVTLVLSGTNTGNDVSGWFQPMSGSSKIISGQTSVTIPAVSQWMGVTYSALFENGTLPVGISGGKVGLYWSVNGGVACKLQGASNLTYKLET